MNLRPTWATELVLGQPGLHKETLSWKKDNKEGWRGGSVVKSTDFSVQAHTVASCHPHSS